MQLYAKEQIHTSIQKCPELALEKMPNKRDYETDSSICDGLKVGLFQISKMVSLLGDVESGVCVLNALKIHSGRYLVQNVSGVAFIIFCLYTQ